jgi:uncharacterized protein YceH (UPF0502 family)
MTTRSEAIAAHIAARITRNKTRKRFSTLYREAIEEIQMSNPNRLPEHPKTDAQIAEQKHAEHAALRNRVADLEQRVAALEGKKN